MRRLGPRGDPRSIGDGLRAGQELRHAELRLVEGPAGYRVQELQPWRLDHAVAAGRPGLPVGAGLQHVQGRSDGDAFRAREVAAAEPLAAGLTRREERHARRRDDLAPLVREARADRLQALDDAQRTEEVVVDRVDPSARLLGSPIARIARETRMRTSGAAGCGRFPRSRRSPNAVRCRGSA